MDKCKLVQNKCHLNMSSGFSEQNPVLALQVFTKAVDKGSFVETLSGFYLRDQATDYANKSD